MFRNILIALSLLAAAPAAFGAECSVKLEANDRMQFNLDTIEVSKSCEEFTITLKHVGELARNVMGHNVVISATEYMEDVNRDGMQAGLENNYIKPNDPRVIAHTKVIGGGETASLTFDPAMLKQDVPYSFFCSFPGHAALMNGVVKLVE